MSYKPVSLEEAEKRLNLYKQGLTDNEIASVLNISRQAMADWRRHRQLPCNRQKTYLSKAEEVRRMEAYKRGLSDSKIAKELGINISQVYFWRLVRNLPPNYIMPKNALEAVLARFKGVPMEQALNQEQCKKMRHFLGNLVKAKDNNEKFSVEQFIKDYRYNISGYRRGGVG